MFVPSWKKRPYCRNKRRAGTRIIDPTKVIDRRKAPQGRLVFAVHPIIDTYPDDVEVVLGANLLDER
jgi:hypothetical protein